MHSSTSSLKNEPPRNATMQYGDDTTESFPSSLVALVMFWLSSDVRTVGADLEEVASAVDS